MAFVASSDCPVEPGFDPLSAEFLDDPFAVMASLGLVERPVFYAPAIDYYVVSGHHDIESIFSDHDGYSVAAAQLPLVELDPRARQILLDGGHRPQPSMVSLDQPAHTRLRRPTARAFSARRTAEMEPRSALRRLLEDPARWDAVVADPALIPNAIEETLRYDLSVPVWRRLTNRKVTIAGVQIPEGSKLFLWLAAAGRDPSVFTNPDDSTSATRTPSATSPSARASISASAPRSASSKPGSRSSC